MIVDTRRLFCRLLRTLDVATVCDVGSMDGSDALRFRRVLPAAEIIALEPNPRNFALMEADEELRRQRIRILPLAASDRDSEAPFFVVGAEYARDRDLARRGMSSLHRRADSSLIADVVRVRSRRLDDVLAGATARIALWIDVEGMAYEAVAGASGVLDRVAMLHVEVETIPCIGARQRLFPDVERLLVHAGFRRLATDQPTTSMQLNALFVHPELLETRAAEIGWHAGNERLRRRVEAAARPLLPLRLRRYLARYANAVRE